MTEDLARHGYGRTTRALHWITAAAVLALVVLGLTMTRLSATTEDEVARVFFAYSLHKTLGAITFGVVLFRLGWTRRHPGPGPLHPGRRAETFLARFVHLILLGALVALPVSGLFRHMTSPGFAPILWPFGQTLPFVPADDAASLVNASVHRIAGWLLLLALALHVIGVLKHALMDRDATLARMTTGKGPRTAPARPVPFAAIAALTAWLAAILAGVLSAPAPEPALPGFDTPDPFATGGNPPDTGLPAPDAD